MLSFLSSSANVLHGALLPKRFCVVASQENNIFKRCLLSVGRLYPGARLFRNNIGSAWMGPGFTLRPGQLYRAEGGERVITMPQHVDFGLQKGSGDAIGWHTITITKDMVGRRVAVFVSLETKTKSGRVSAEQLNWHQQVQAAGGISVIIRDPSQLSLELPIFPVA